MTYMPAYQQSTEGNASSGKYVKEDAELLRERCDDGLLQLVKRADLAADESVYRQRLEDELRIIASEHCDSYFLIVADYVSWAVDNGISVGPGRGSGPCSLVGYVLGITRVDPVRYDLPFERFLNPLRDLVPDFDIDFCEQRCGEVTDYILARYGRDRVARICSDDGMPLNSRLVISDRPLSDLVPVKAGAEHSYPVTSMNMAQVTAQGLVRFNVINQRAVTIIQQQIELLRHAGCSINPDDIPLDNPETYDRLCRGEPLSIDVLDANAYDSALREIQPRKFSDLCVTIAFSLPFLQGVLPTFIDHRNRRQPVEYAHPVLDRITSDTSGLIIYQEQCMHIAHEVGGFSMAEADLFRRALKSRNQEKSATYRLAFIEGAVRFGLPNKQATELFEQVAVASVKSVTKAHAVAYALLAYQEVWLKQRADSRIGGKPLPSPQ